jgi:imidazolonepropionase-like amidohydrolase
MLFLIVTLPAIAADSQPVPVVIRNATLFDAVKGVMLPDRTIVIINGRIQAIGAPGHRVKAPAGARTIKARGKYVIPGLIDSHAHLAIVYDFGHVTSYDVLPLFLANGVTSVRDVGDDIMAEKVVAHYAELNPDLCPRVFLGSPLIDGDPPFHPGSGWNAVITDPAKVPAFVDDMAAWGVVTLKIYGGTGRAVGRKVIEEAHRHGMTATGHLYKYTPLEAAEDGIDSIEHISAGSVYGYLSSRTNPPSIDTASARTTGPQLDLNAPVVRELVAALVEHKVMVDPTLVVFRNTLLLPDLPGVVDNPENAYMPKGLRDFWPTYATSFRPETLESRKNEFRRYQDLTGLLFRAGVPLLAGTDEPEPNIPPGFSLHEELDLLAESGLPPAAVLQAATINPARVLKREKDLGSVEEGKLADLVILDANPLEDIKNTRKIYRVIREGVVSDPEVLLKTVRLNQERHP